MELSINLHVSLDNMWQWKGIRDKLGEVNDIKLCITMMNGEKRNAYRIFVGKPEGDRQLGRPRRRWVDNIKIDLRKIE
jgi:hypothetical protein